MRSRDWLYIHIPAFAILVTGTVLMVSGSQHQGDERVRIANRATQGVIDEAVKQHDSDLARITTLEGEVNHLRRDNDELRARLSDAAERERSLKVRASRSRRVVTQDVVSPQTVDSPVGGWAHSVRGIKIANCESADLQHWPYSDGTHYLGGSKGVHLRDPNGHYGKWQFDLGTWRSVGGSGNPADASEAEQDMRANLLHAQRGEQPWSCAHMV